MSANDKKEEKKGCHRDIEDLVLCDKVKRNLEKKVGAQPGQAAAAVLHPPRALSLVRRGAGIGGSDISWAHPLTLTALYTLLNDNQDLATKMVVGNTSAGIWPDAGQVQLYIDIRDIKDLNTVVVSSSGVTFGAATPFTKFIQFLNSQIATVGKKARNFEAVLPHVKRIASHQIRNVGCIAGNLMLTYNHADFPSDFMCVSATIGATVTYQDALSQGSAPVTVPVENLYKVDMQNKVILNIYWPYAKDNEYIGRHYDYY